MLEGTDTRDLREGPGHWPETPLPGQGGNFVVSGHRTTYGAPFRKFDKVKEGDLVDLVLPYAVARYRVSRVVIVKPNEMEVVAQLGQRAGVAGRLPPPLQCLEAHRRAGRVDLLQAHRAGGLSKGVRASCAAARRAGFQCTL